MTKHFKAGDAVSWESSGGHSTGKVIEKITGTARVKAHVAKATAGNPEYRVKSDSGGEAIHKPEALTRKR